MYLHYFQCRVGLGALALSLAPWDSTPGVVAMLQSVSFPELKGMSSTASGADSFPGALTWNFNHVLVAKWEPYEPG